MPPKPATGDDKDVKKNADPIVQIYNELNKVFGDKAGQYFCMEFPGRILPLGRYQYKASDTVDADNLKPEAVGEAEFTLSDDLFSLGQITGGPTGSYLSQNYSELLGSYVPNHDMQGEMLKVLNDRELIKAWTNEYTDDHDLGPDNLFADIPTELLKRLKVTPPAAPPPGAAFVAGQKIRRIDLYYKLLNAYNSARLRWQTFKLAARPPAGSTADRQDAYDRILSVLAPSIDAKLEGLWDLLLIRGDYSRMKYLLGILDIKSGAEILEDAKETLRDSGSRSTDDTRDVWPVKYSPSNWADYLTTDFEPVDLLMDPAVLRQQLQTTQSQRQALIMQEASLKSDKDNLENLRKAADEARIKFTSAQSDMTKGFMDSVTQLILLYLHKEIGGRLLKNEDLANLNGILKQNSQSPLDQTTFEKLMEDWEKASGLHTTFMSAAEAYARADTAFAGGEVSDPKLALATIQQGIASMTAKIRTLTSILGSKPGTLGWDSHAGRAADEKTVVDGKLPPPPAPKTSASQWETIIISYDHTKKDQSASLATSVSHSSASASLWIGGYHNTSNSTDAEHMQQMSTENTDIQIGMNVMKVEMARPWFRESVFTKTSEYTRLQGLPASNGESMTNLTGSAEEVAARLKAGEKSLIPAYPVAFLVAKDVTMVLSNTALKDGSAAELHESLKSTGGGILCFSCSSVDHTKTSNQSAYMASSDGHLMVRIPGPQIIGWILQVTPKDKSVTDYKSMDPNTFKPVHLPDDLAANLPTAPTSGTPGQPPFHELAAGNFASILHA